MSKKLFIIICSIFIVNTYTAQRTYEYKIHIPEKKDENAITNNLAAFYKENSNKKPVIVLKTPGYASITVNEGGNDLRESYYNHIERALVKEGFIVRDRALLNYLLGDSKNINYEEIAKKIKVDIIIDITDIDFSKSFSFTPTIISRETNEPIKLPRWSYKYKYAKFDFKLILVNRGSIGSYHTLYYTPFQEVKDDFQLLSRYSGKEAVLRIRYNENKSPHKKGVGVSFEIISGKSTLIFDFDELEQYNIIENYFAEKLANILSGHF